MGSFRSSVETSLGNFFASKSFLCLRSGFGHPKYCSILLETRGRGSTQLCSEESFLCSASADLCIHDKFLNLNSSLSFHWNRGFSFAKQCLQIGPFPSFGVHFECSALGKFEYLEDITVQTEHEGSTKKAGFRVERRGPFRSRRW
jgi:hypothetical protein